MSLQIILLTEGLITNVAEKWPLPTMDAYMCFQMALLSEGLTAHIAAKWPLPTMYA
jgi:hypothetical protein